LCGLFGGLGANINVHAVRHLAALNESRGRDSAGFFDQHGDWLKKGYTSITEWLKDEGLRDKLQRMCLTGAVCGHTRGSTRGNHKTENAHPFAYGEEGKQVVLSHNGVIDAPAKYDVDSMYMADLLAQGKPGQYQEALGGVSGWYVLTWHDERTGCIYFLNWTGTLCFAPLGDTIYYSSAKQHLQQVLAHPKIHETVSGEVWMWTGKKMKPLKHFTGKVRTYTQSNNYGQQWDDTRPSGSVLKLRSTGKWVANLRGAYFAELTDQEKWEEMYGNDPNPYTSNGKWPGFQVIEAHIKNATIIDFDGKPVSKKKLRRGIRSWVGNDDTELEESEKQGVVVVDSPGVADTKVVTTVQNATPEQNEALDKFFSDNQIGKETCVACEGTGLATQGSELRCRPCNGTGKMIAHALVKADVAKRAAEAEAGDNVAKALALQEEINRKQRDLRYRDRSDASAAARAALNAQWQKLRAKGMDDETIGKELWRAGFYEDIYDLDEKDLLPLRGWMENDAFAMD